MIFPGWTIVRAIPYKYFAGLLMGQYTLTGGVIRHAAGTTQGGQIVAHLLPAASQNIPGLHFLPGLLANIQLSRLSGTVNHVAGTVNHVAGTVNLLGTQINSLSLLNAVNSYQLFKLSGQVNVLTEATHNILQLVSGTTLLSGLSLAVSTLGFPLVLHKLQAIDSQLHAIHRDIRAIREFLELSERAELRAAIKDLSNVDKIDDVSIRHKLLSDRRQTLMGLNEKYKELFCHATSVETAIAHEEYFTLTGLAYIRCTAELALYPLAQQEIQEFSAAWHEHSRKFTNERLLGQHPERFLASDFAEDIPISTVIGWLDFAYNETRGYEWVDALRKETTPWYQNRKKSSQQSSPSKQHRRHQRTTSHSPKRQYSSAEGRIAERRGGLRQEKEVCIPLLQKFVARSAILDGYVSQYELLEYHQMTPTEFTRKMAELLPEDAVEGHYILQRDEII